MESRLLAIYLADHDALGIATVELARRAASGNEGTAFGQCAARLLPALEAEREQLRETMEALGAKPDPLKAGMAWAGEKLGRLKLNGHLVTKSPLSPVVEAEALITLLGAWAMAWRGLDLLPAGTLPDGIDAATIARSADAACEQVEGHRLELLRDALELSPAQG